MALEIFRAVFLGGLPVAILTFTILQWFIASGRMGKFTDEKDLTRQFKEHARATKKAKKARKGDIGAEKGPVFHSRAGGDFFHNKVMSFGGGFYGTMAVLTYILIEAVEIWQFLNALFLPGTWIDKIGFDLLIEFIVDSFVNMIEAFLWFETLPEYVTVNNGLVWLLAVYLGYLAGLRLTTYKGDEIWEEVGKVAARLKRTR